jgi:hypothetical protein
MKITKEQLKQIIKEELESVLKETQTSVGLGHVFDNFELAERILDAVNNKESEGDLQMLRQIAIGRSDKLSRDLGELDPQGTEAMNKTQQKEFLEQAIQELDVYLGDFESGVTIGRGFTDHMGLPMMTDKGMGEPGYPLRRPHRKHRSKMKKSTYRK